MVIGDLVEALDLEPGQENYKTPQQFKDHARKWARFFQVVHHDEVIKVIVDLQRPNFKSFFSLLIV